MRSFLSPNFQVLAGNMAADSGAKTGSVPGTMLNTRHALPRELNMNNLRSSMNSRRRFLALGLNAAGFLVLAGCTDAEVGSQPPVGKSRKEIMGDGPLNDPPKTKGAKPK